MKKVILFLIAVMLLSATAVFANDDAKVSIGIKGWYNSWEETYVNPSNGYTSTTKSDKPIFMVGPSLNYRMGAWFVGATYMQSMSDYNSPKNYDNGHGDTYNSATSTTTQDIDVTAGYMFTPRVGVFVGYKFISGDSTVAYSGIYAHYSASNPYTTTFKGPGIGILGNIPLGENTALYGNVAVMSVKYDQDYSGYGYTGTLSGVSAEVGVTTALADSLSGNLGYKYQKFTGNIDNGFGDGYSEKDTYSGITLGLTYTF